MGRAPCSLSAGLYSGSTKPGPNPARMNKETFTGRCSESQQQSASESSVQGLDLEVWRWGQVLASARCQCQRVHENAEGALPSLVRTMTSSPGRTGSPHTSARNPRAGRHSPSGYCQCHWQHHDAGVKPLASGPARRAEYPRAAASAGGVRAGGPWPRASQHCGSRTALRTWRVLKFRLWRAPGPCSPLPT